MATGSISYLPTPRRLEEQRAREVRLDRTLVTQPFSPVLISSVCSDKRKEAVKVAAVECIEHACEDPRRGVLELRRRRAEFVEPCERGVESASSNFSQRLIRSPSTVRRSISRHSASKPSFEVPFDTWVTTAPRLLSRCTASM